MNHTTYNTINFDTSFIPNPKYQIDQAVYVVNNFILPCKCYINNIQLNSEINFSGVKLSVKYEIEYLLTSDCTSEFDNIYVDESNIYESEELAKEAVKKILKKFVK